MAAKNAMPTTRIPTRMNGTRDGKRNKINGVTTSSVTNPPRDCVAMMVARASSDIASSSHRAIPRATTQSDTTTGRPQIITNARSFRS